MTNDPERGSAPIDRAALHRDAPQRRDEHRDRVRELSRRSNARGDATGWFEELYRAERRGDALVPWAELRPYEYLVEHVAARPPARGARALVIGCGYGDDAAFVAGLGCRTTAFDIAPSAIERCRERFMTSDVEWVVADLFAAPHRWRRGFDLVVEIFTLQALPPEWRARTVSAIAEFVAPGGELFVGCRGRDATEAATQLPWPLTREELASFEQHGLTAVSLRDLEDTEDPPVRRFIASFRR